MGNEASSLPADLPEGILDQILNGDLSENDIKKLILGVDTNKSSRGRREPRRKDGKKSRFQRSMTVEAEPRKPKQTPFGRSKTDGQIDNKTLQQTWDGRKMKRQMAEKDPQEVIRMLEKYASVDTKMAHAYFKSLKRQTDPSAVVPKAA